MQTKKFTLFIFAAAMLSGSPAAWAATATGSVSYISPDGHSILLNSTDEYVLGPKVDASKLRISQRVKVTFSQQKGQRLATAIGPEPASAPNK